MITLSIHLKMREEIFSQGMVNRIYSDVGLAQPNYDDGLQIKINDTDCVYGTFFRIRTRAEDLLLQVVETERIKVQLHGVRGACNGTAYSLFSNNQQYCDAEHSQSHDITLERMARFGEN